MAIIKRFLAKAALGAYLYLAVFAVSAAFLMPVAAQK